MIVIAVMNQKGGIGKTTTAANVGYILGEERGKRVLLIDGDQQGNLSTIYDRYDDEGKGISELLEEHTGVGGQYSTKHIIQSTPYGSIDIITANSYVMKTNNNLLLETEADQICRLRNALEEVKEDYDFVICDCGLLMDMTVINIMVASDLVIAPVKVGGFEIDAIGKMQDQINELKQINSDLHMKILFTMKQGNKTTRDTEEWLKNISGYPVYKTAIRRSVVVEKSTMAYIPMVKFSKNGIAAQDYRELVNEIEEDMKHEQF